MRAPRALWKTCEYAVDEVRKSLLAVAFALMAQDYGVWRANYERELRKPDGWLSLVGLHWLEPGLPDSGILEGATFTLEGRNVIVRRNSQERVLGSELLRVGTRSYQAIERGGRFAIRVRDSESRARREFHGLQWYRADPAWRVTATWRPYPAKQDRLIDSVGGVRQKMFASGVAEFLLRGQRFRLEPFDDGDQLMFVFKDETSRSTTYPGGRFLYAGPARDGKLILDFNRAENPPCAYTPFATCPLAPKGNHLPVAIEAGERRYH